MLMTFPGPLRVVIPDLRGRAEPDDAACGEYRPWRTWCVLDSGVGMIRLVANDGRRAAAARAPAFSDIDDGFMVCLFGMQFP